MRPKGSTQLRELLSSGKIIFRPGVAIALHARMAEVLGFKAVGLSTSALATHLFGLPDAGLITLSEVVENARRVCNAVDIPVIVDCDTGFGNAINARRTVKEIISVGAAALFIEDQVAPKRCGFVAGKELVSVEEASGKYRAAVDIRDDLDPAFVLIARTDARNSVGGSVDEVIRRAVAYKEAGVDIIYAEALQSREEIGRVRAEIDGPLICSVSALEVPPSLEELQTLGLCMTAGTMFFKAGLVTMWDLLEDMSKRGMEPFNDFFERVKEHPLGGFGGFDLTGFPEIVELERRFLPQGHMAKYESSFGVYDPRVGHQSRA